MITALRDFATETETHRQALERAVRLGYRLDCYTTPIGEAREGLTPAEADDVASQDPGLIIVRGCCCSGCGDVVVEPVFHGGQPFCEGCEAAPAEGEGEAEARKAHRRELLAALERACGPDGSGDYGVIVDEALARDPAVTAEAVIGIVREAREDWAGRAAAPSGVGPGAGAAAGPAAPGQRRSRPRRRLTSPPASRGSARGASAAAAGGPPDRGRAGCGCCGRCCRSTCRGS